ncbi:MAG TPA: hypothetical protein VH496_00285 [Mycobacterium sp.]|jgi:hypothetical protein
MGILALSLVAAPQHVDSMRTDGVRTGVHPVELTGFALAPKLTSAALLDTLMAGGGPDITTAAATTSLSPGPALQPSGTPGQAVNALVLLSQQQAPQINLDWIPLLVNTLFQWTPDFLKPFVGGVLVFVVGPALGVAVEIVSLIYDPIVKTINRVLDAFGLPLLPVFHPDPPASTQANRAAVPTLATNSTASSPVAPQATTGTPSGEPLSSGTPAQGVRKPSAATTLRGRKAASPETAVQTPQDSPPAASSEADVRLSTNLGTTVGQTLLTATAKFRPTEGRSPADVGQRPHGLPRPGDSAFASRPRARSDTAPAGAASSRALKSAINSQSSKSSGGNSDGSK